MGWVDDKFLDHIATKKSINNLWNSVRDSVGAAVNEFANRILEPDRPHYKDCTSRGPRCMRIEKPDGTSIEVFLEDARQTLNSSGAGLGDTVVCGYRLKKDRAGLEFYLVDPDNVTARPISSDEACRLAIESYLFNPFPVNYYHKVAE